MMGKIKEWDSCLLDNLRDPKEAAEFLNAALEEDAPDFFRECFEKVMAAQKETFAGKQQDVACLTTIAPVLHALKLRFATST